PTRSAASLHDARPISGGGQSGTLPLFEITNSPEHAQNITLRLVERMDGDSIITYGARGLYGADTVGFNVEMSHQIAAGINSHGSDRKSTRLNSSHVKI